MRAIGGYFELESPDKRTFHDAAFALNTGRNAFEFILKAKGVNKVYLPKYTCGVLLQPLQRLNISYETYPINFSFEPIFDYGRLKSGEAFLYTNYFGLKDEFILALKGLAINLIVDNAQALFSPSDPSYDSFYSPRKFVGVPDGGFAYCSCRPESPLQKDESSSRFQHLLIRAEKDAERGYQAFVENDKSLDNNPIKEMSELTTRLLHAIDYDGHAKVRRRNYLYLYNALKAINAIDIPLPESAVPMAFPYLDKIGGSLRTRLIANRIYVARYWPELLHLCAPDSLEYRYASDLIPLPIDQRVTLQDLDFIIKTITNAD